MNVPAHIALGRRHCTVDSCSRSPATHCRSGCNFRGQASDHSLLAPQDSATE
jgi:hypothetical protein